MYEYQIGKKPQVGSTGARVGFFLYDIFIKGLDVGIESMLIEFAECTELGRLQTL